MGCVRPPQPSTRIEVLNPISTSNLYIRGGWTGRQATSPPRSTCTLSPHSSRCSTRCSHGRWVAGSHRFGTVNGRVSKLLTDAVERRSRDDVGVGCQPRRIGVQPGRTHAVAGALAHRIGLPLTPSSQGTGVPSTEVLLARARALHLSFGELLRMPEQDEWSYPQS